MCTKTAITGSLFFFVCIKTRKYFRLAKLPSLAVTHFAIRAVSILTCILTIAIGQIQNQSHTFAEIDNEITNQTKQTKKKDRKVLYEV